MKVLVLAAVAAMSCGPASAGDRSSDAAEFRGYVEVCKSNTDKRGVEGCIADQVFAKVSYLGDILAETANGLGPADEKLLDAAQARFEAYGEAACAYQAAALKADKRGELFCLLRLTNQRIADVLEGEDFLTSDEAR